MLFTKEDSFAPKAMATKKKVYEISSYYFMLVPENTNDRPNEKISAYFPNSPPATIGMFSSKNCDITLFDNSSKYRNNAFTTVAEP